MVSCTYLRYVSIQKEYARLQAAEPSQRNLKHLIDHPNYSVIGFTEDARGLHAAKATTIAVAAFSSRFRAHELVDAMHDIGVGTHFGLNLPAGDYDLLVLMDSNRDGFYESNEVIGHRELTLHKEQHPSMVVTKQRIELGEQTFVPWSVKIPVRKAGGSKSLFFPAGTIRNLDDAVFSDEMVTLGLYDPASFFEQAPTMFYALEDDLVFKVPVIFVHGAEGSARGFETLVRHIDRTRFKPWFFHYPSGGDLDQLGELFFDIFLSGKMMQHNPLMPIVIVAHSMGGLVVRRALRACSDEPGRTPAITWISLATPFGGHPAAIRVGESDMLILPSWRDMDPNGEFVTNLFDRPLPDSVTHHLLYAFNNDSVVKLGENSDGVVPMSSQLHEPAQRQSTRQLGLNTTHVGILKDPIAMAAIVEVLKGIKTDIPELQMSYLQRGGFDVGGDDYSEVERYILRHYGCYLEGLAAGSFAPMDETQQQLVLMLRGEVTPTTQSAIAWRKYLANERR